MKILVTGATGFIGNHVIASLLKSNVSVIATSRNEDKAKTFDWFDEVTYIPFTIGSSNTDDLINHFHKPDLCIHMAWDGLPDFRTEKHITEYYDNHLQFLNAFIEGGINKLVVTGTCLEYGMQEGALNEEMLADPKLAYPIGKNKLRIALEALQVKASFKLDWVRLFYMYGPGQSPKSILALLQKHIAEEKQVFNMSQGEQKRDYLPVEEIADVIVKLAKNNSSNGIVNCSSGKPIKIKTLVENYLTDNKAIIKLNYGYYPYPDYEPFEFWGDNTKLTKALNE